MIAAGAFEDITLTRHAGSPDQIRRCCVRTRPGLVGDSVESTCIGAAGTAPKVTEELLIVGKFKVEFRRAGRLIKSFTGEEEALDAGWATFPGKSGKESMEAIVILEDKRLRIYSTHGEEFLVRLPCEIQKFWPSKFGLIMERLESGPASEPMAFELEDPTSWGSNWLPPAESTPKLLVLHHPLDDLTRIISKSQVNPRKSSFEIKSLRSKAHWKTVGWTSQRHKILFCSSDPSVCVTYDTIKQVHSVWNVRMIEKDDNEQVLDLNNRSIFNFNSSTFNTSQSLSSVMPDSNPNSRRVSIAGPPTQSPWNMSKATPTGPEKSGVSRFLRKRSRNIHTESPKFGPSPAIKAGDMSPAFDSFACKLGASTPFVGTGLVEWSRNQSIRTLDYAPIEEPQSPNFTLCLELMYTCNRFPGSPATKVFVIDNPFKERFLVFLFSQVLVCVPIRDVEIGSDSGALPFIVEDSGISDAIGVEGIGMILTLDVSRTSLKLHIPSIFPISPISIHFEMPTSSLSLANIAHEISILHIEENAGVMTSSRPPSAAEAAFNESLAMLSPVGSSGKQAKFRDLQFAGDGTVILQVDKGASLWLRLPPTTTSPLVSSCLDALGAYIGPKAFLDLYGHWYLVRNSPGPSSIGLQDEWHLFCRCLLSQIGYKTDKLKLNTSSSSNGSGMFSPDPVHSKKMKPDESGTDGDWESLLRSGQHQEGGENLSSLISIGHVTRIPEDSTNRDTWLEPGPFLPNAANVLWCLHLLYEESKLDRCSWPELHLLGSLLSMLSADLQLKDYVSHYWLDFPLQCPRSVREARSGQMKEEFLNKIMFPSQMTECESGHAFPPCTYKYLSSLLDPSSHPGRFPILKNGVTKTTKDLVLFYAIFSFRYDSMSGMLDPSQFLNVVDHCSSYGGFEKIGVGIGAGNNFIAEAIVNFAVDHGYDLAKVSRIPIGIALPILSSMYLCRINPSSGSSKKHYQLTGRPDLAEDNRKRDESCITRPDRPNILKSGIGVVEGSSNTNGSGTDASNGDDGLGEIENEVTRLRWPLDRRVREVQRMIQSVKPVVVNVEQRPDMSDHDFVEEQERCLQSLCVRTMALPVGRGAVTFRSTTPLPTETLSIPNLCLIGKAPPRGTTVEMDHIEVVPHMERWPSFHNGVAAGLRLSIPSDDESSISVDSHWITFNKPRENPHPNELIQHGGFLMALGLNGHLANLGKLESFDYLIKGNEMISIGMLLGTCAAKRGSMDVLTTKKIATQLEALLPSTATELPLSHTTQVAALTGLGLLYQSTGHRHMAEVCLGELGRPPGPEMENCTDRESYSLSAGLALGMITLGQGSSLGKGSLSDLRLPETLYHHMVGGPRSPSVYRNRFRSPSYQIQEGDTINTDVTSPGATLALGLMFFRSGDKNIAGWMESPDSQFLLEFVRPDFLMLRTLAKGLILWDEIVPTLEWIDSHVPVSIRPYSLVRPAENSTLSIDYETINQAYCNIIAGSSLAMAIRFAGSSNSQAFNVLHSMCRRLMSISKRSIAELAGKATVEQTICVLVLSLAIVMAGSGDIEVIKIIRYLRSRVGPKNPTVTYGSHMALHLALGLLFLGGGRYTLSTRPEAVACMVASFFPKFPTHSNDNRYHLQALRHLYVLAAESRLVIPRDIRSKRLVFCHMDIHLIDTIWYEGYSMKVKGPFMLPELDLIKSVQISDPRYHSIVFDKQNMGQLKKILQDGMTLDIQQKAGCLSYQEDPRGFRSLTGQCLSKDTTFQWHLTSSEILAPFENLPGVGIFSKIFLKGDHIEEGYTMLISSMLYEVASHEKLDLQSFYLTVFQNLWQLGRPSNSGSLFLGSQLGMMLKLSQRFPMVNNLICSELLLSVCQQLLKSVDLFSRKYRIQSVIDQEAEAGIKDVGQLRSLCNLLVFEQVMGLASESGPQRKNPLTLMKELRKDGQKVNGRISYYIGKVQ